MLGENEKPDVTYADVGGLDMQKQEIREAVELPLTHFDLYKQIGESGTWRAISSADLLTLLKVLIRPVVSYFTALPVLVRRCWSKLWRTAQLPASFV
jgi:hypothetical protein